MACRRCQIPRGPSPPQLRLVGEFIDVKGRGLLLFFWDSSTCLTCCLLETFERKAIFYGHDFSFCWCTMFCWWFLLFSTNTRTHWENGNKTILSCTDCSDSSMTPLSSNSYFRLLGETAFFHVRVLPVVRCVWAGAAQIKKVLCSGLMDNLENLHSFYGSWLICGSLPHPEKQSIPGYGKVFSSDLQHAPDSWVGPCSPHEPIWSVPVCVTMFTSGKKFTVNGLNTRRVPKA